MSNRRFPTADLYEERSSDFYRGGRRSGREYEELDVDLRSQRTLDFLDDTHGRSGAAGPLVVRDRPREVEREDIIIEREHAPHAPRRGPPSRRARSVEREEVVIRRGERDRFRRDAEREEIDVTIRKEEETRPPRRRPREVEREEISVRRSDTDLGRAREVEREDIIIRRGEGRRPPRSVVDHEEDVVIRRNEREGHGRHRVDEREEIEVHHRSRSRPPRSVAGHEDEVIIRRNERDGHGRHHVDEREEIEVHHQSRSRPPRSVADHEEDIIIRRNEREGRGRHHVDEREEIEVRHRSRSRPRHDRIPPGAIPIGRETEEVVIRRKKERTPSPSPRPPPRRDVSREEIIIRRTEEREPTPPPPLREPEPEPPMLAPIYRPPIHQQIHQEIITHHRHIDHGVERAWSPTPSPPPAPRSPSPLPAPKRVEESLEVDIRRRGPDGEFEEDIVIERDVRGRPNHETALVRHRSLSTPRRRGYDDDLEEEADYYNRRQMERAYVGEAHNGATKDWAIVDVPPGTERVRMDGAGGSSQEVTWQRYNGVRRAKFIAGDREFDTGFGLPERKPGPGILPPPAPAPRPRPNDMWTEITKDLVLKEAIDAFGYQYEETEYFFYVMEYLKYEDVLRLVEFSDDIRRERRRRIREIEWERESLRRPRYSDRDRYYEHELVVDTRRRH